ncbi:hypothetical protein FLL45_13325 [Aliikangiella marina]|uniref:TonB C-terminal domain-containing protein n=1 Tax=Aliikangiella marina TaxID=1712262 RepID=A0A545T9F5_9GAMM|nr:energy transducer TonB [Aliikangiella marina]TQV73844.1 hypothetical protein FLL45_13325 [Aliikangiella marina]
MVRLLVSISGLMMIVSCASSNVIDFRPAPAVSELTDPAIPLKIVEPAYPRRAAINNIEGWVFFEFELNSKGNPVKLAVMDSHPQGTFVKNASIAFSQWTFKVDSETAKQKKQYIMEFKLAD